MNRRFVSCVIVMGMLVAGISASRTLAQQPAANAAGQQATTQQKPPSPAPERQSGTAESARAAVLFGPNVRVDVTITDQGAANAAPIRKTVSLTANRSGSSVRSGVNVPVPSTVLGANTTIPTTSYSYRTMGLSLDVRDVEVRENQVRLNLIVEYSPLDETDKPAAPATTPVSYSNFSQSFQLVLDNGKPIVAAETSDPVPNRNRKLSVEVKATILR